MSWLETVTRRVWPLLGISGALLVAGGCTVLTSETIDQLAARDAAPGGVHYCLPKTIMDFALSATPDKATFQITPGPPRSIRDTSRCYYISYQPAPQYTDEITVEVGTRGYLKAISVDAKDQSIEVIKNLAKAFGAFGGGLEAARTRVADDEIARETVDPTDPDAMIRVENKLTKALHDYARSKRDLNCNTANKADKPQNGVTLPNLTARALCREYGRYVGMRRPLTLRFTRNEKTEGAGHAIWLRARADHSNDTLRGGGNNLLMSDCRVGICYRVPEPWLLKIAIGEADVTRVAAKGHGQQGAERDRAHEAVKRQLYLVPNRAPLVEIDIRRAFLVNKLQSIAFSEEGYLDTISVKKGSELLALSSIPLEIVSAIGEGLAIRVQVLNEQIGDANASKALIDAHTALQQQKLALESYLARAGAGQSIATSSRVPEPIVPTAVSSSPTSAPLQNEIPIR